jgi:hypothetical protein
MLPKTNFPNTTHQLPLPAGDGDGEAIVDASIALLHMPVASSSEVEGELLCMLPLPVCELFMSMQHFRRRNHGEYKLSSLQIFNYHGP